MRKKSNIFKAAGYVDLDEYEKFLDILTRNGLTFSGWLRKMIRNVIKEDAESKAKTVD